MLHKIERTGWAREATWRRFMEEVPCTYSMCVNLDITRLYGVVKAGGYRLFAALLYGLSRAVNRRAEFRMGLTADGEPGIYDEVHPCYTVFHPENETFTSVWQAYDPDFAAFFPLMASGTSRWSCGRRRIFFTYPACRVCLYRLQYASCGRLPGLGAAGCRQPFLSRTVGGGWQCGCITRPATDTMLSCSFGICRNG